MNIKLSHYYYRVWSWADFRADIPISNPFSSHIIHKCNEWKSYSIKKILSSILACHAKQCFRNQTELTGLSLTVNQTFHWFSQVMQKLTQKPTSDL